MYASLLVVAGLPALVAVPEYWRPTPLFSVEVEVISAIENGPIVLRITATCQSERQIKVSGVTDRNTHPAFRDVGELRFDGIFEADKHEHFVRSFKKGDKLTDIIRVRRRYSLEELPSGKLDFQLDWAVKREADSSPESVRLLESGSTASLGGIERVPTSEELERRHNLIKEYLRTNKKCERLFVPKAVSLDVPEATPEVIIKNLKYLQLLIDKKNKTHEDTMILYLHLIENQRTEYLDIARGFVKLPEAKPFERELSLWIGEVEFSQRSVKK